MLADGQCWTFPAPWDRASSTNRDPDEAYSGLLRAIWEAEDSHERRLAELALAIFLIELNYHLGSAQLQDLFTFRAGSPELAESQNAFDALALEHLQSLFPDASHPGPIPVTHPTRRGIWAPAHTWLRGLRSLWRWILPSRNGEAMP